MAAVVVAVDQHQYDQHVKHVLDSLIVASISAVEEGLAEEAVAALRATMCLSPKPSSSGLVVVFVN